MLLFSFFVVNIFLLSSDATRIGKNYNDKKNLSVPVNITDAITMPYRKAGTMSIGKNFNDKKNLSVLVNITDATSMPYRKAGTKRICKKIDDKKDLSVLVKIIDDLYSMPYRIAGTPQSYRAAEYVMNYFKSIGLQNVTYHTFPTNLNIYPLDKKTGNAIQLVDNKTGQVLHSFDLVNGIVPGRQMPAFLLFNNITYYGRNVLFNEYSENNSTSLSVMYQNFSETSDKSKLHYPEGIETPLSGFIRAAPSWNPELEIPFPKQQITVQINDAAIIERILDSNNDVMLNVTMKIPYHRNIMLKNVCAKLPGIGWLSNRLIIFGSHRDTVGPGSIDNGSGHSVMQYLAYILSMTYKRDQLNTPRRTAWFCSWDGEEAGLLGSQAFIKDHKSHLSDYLDAYVNIDTVLEGTEAIVSLQSSTLNEFVESVLSEVLGESQRNRSIINTIERNQKNENYWQRSDHFTFTTRLNVPVMSFTYSSESTFRVYHSIYEDIHYLHTMDPGLKALQKIVDCYLCVATNLMENPMIALDKDVLGHLLKRLSSKLKKKLKPQAKVVSKRFAQLTKQFQRNSNFTMPFRTKLMEQIKLIIKLDNKIKVGSLNETYIEDSYNTIYNETQYLEKLINKYNNN